MIAVVDVTFARPWTASSNKQVDLNQTNKNTSGSFAHPSKSRVIWCVQPCPNDWLQQRLWPEHAVVDVSQRPYPLPKSFDSHSLSRCKIELVRALQIAMINSITRFLCVKHVIFALLFFFFFSKIIFLF